jgi:hypothetical protein
MREGATNCRVQAILLCLLDALLHSVYLIFGAKQSNRDNDHSKKAASKMSDDSVANAVSIAGTVAVVLLLCSQVR